MPAEPERAGEFGSREDGSRAGGSREDGSREDGGRAGGGAGVKAGPGEPRSPACR